MGLADLSKRLRKPRSKKLEDALFDNYSALESILIDNGYPLRQRANGFSLYHITNNIGLLAVSRYFAIKESQPGSKKVERAIFWEAGSLEEAIESLRHLPYQSKDIHDDSKNTKLPVVWAAGLSAPMGAIGYARTGSIEFAFFAAAFGGFAGILVGVASVVSYRFATKVLTKVWSPVDHYLVWRSTKEWFGNPVEGKRAVRDMLRCTEIIMPVTGETYRYKA